LSGAGRDWWLGWTDLYSLCSADCSPLTYINIIGFVFRLISSRGRWFAMFAAPRVMILKRARLLLSTSDAAKPELLPGRHGRHYTS
jgi:hypothetical protein